MSDKKSKTVKKDEKEKQQDLFVFDPKEKELKIKDLLNSFSDGGVDLNSN
jgi:hypothetical protein